MSHAGVGDRAAIARPGDHPGTIVHARVVAQIDWVAAVSVHQIDLGIAVACRYEGDLRAVGRPDGTVADGPRAGGGLGRAGEAPLAAAVGAHHIDLSLAATRRDKSEAL